MNLTRVLLVLVALLAVPFFQNCGPSAKKSEPELKSSVDNGQPYDGKPYVAEGGNCPDGTLVQARILITGSSQGVLVRENCQNVAPQVLAANDLGIDPNDSTKLQYHNKTFALEKPAVDVSILSSWYYQVSGTLQSPSAAVYDIDMFENDSNSIQALKAAGHKVICNISAGTFEASRPDASSFSSSDLGKSVGGSERWLDTRSPSVRSIMVARLDLAKSKGCDGVDLDNVDAYSNNSGFPLTSATQIDYNQFLAFAAHDRHLIVALKNAVDLVSSLVNVFDFAIAEQCFQFSECGKYQPFVNQGKALLAAEYTGFSTAQCSAAKGSSISLAYFNDTLDGTRYEPCP